MHVICVISGITFNSIFSYTTRTLSLVKIFLYKVSECTYCRIHYGDEKAVRYLTNADEISLAPRLPIRFPRTNRATNSTRCPRSRLQSAVICTPSSLATMSDERMIFTSVISSFGAIMSFCTVVVT